MVFINGMPGAASIFILLYYEFNTTPADYICWNWQLLCRY